MENELVAHFRRRLPPHPLLKLGIGDDAAILSWTGDSDCVVSTDVLTDGVDFLVGQVDPRRIGRKALAANLSDLAAMASVPVACVVGLVLPRQGGTDLAVALYEGMLPLAEKYEVAIAGGDTNSWDGPLVVSVTVLGRLTPQGPLTRRGARAGDRILVTGSLGGSILRHQFDFEPRVREALELHTRFPLRAGMDISDGLLLDLSRLCVESHVGAELELDRVPVADDARQLARALNDGRSALERALSDGEDFELLLAAESDVAAQIVQDGVLGVPVSDVGRFVTTPGLWVSDGQGCLQPIATQGFRHVFD